MGNVPSISEPYSMTSSVIIRAPPAAVWAQLADFGGVHKWAPTVKRSQLTSKVEAGVGCARSCEIAGMGTTNEVVTEWDEERVLGYRVGAMGPMASGHSSWRLSASPGGTKVTTSLRYGLRWGPVGRAIHAIMMRRMIRKTLASTQEGLKRRLEVDRSLEETGT